MADAWSAYSSGLISLVFAKLFGQILNLAQANKNTRINKRMCPYSNVDFDEQGDMRKGVAL